MASSSSLYPDPLGSGEIRLLHLARNQERGVVSCSLTRHSLADNVKFIALSYAWGFVNVVHPIECNGEEVLVSESVHGAIHSLLDLNMCGSAGLPLWVDAVCINQSDPGEKTRQVRQLMSVYSRAQLVVGWLGPKNPGDERVLALMKKLHGIVGGPRKTNDPLLVSRREEFVKMRLDVSNIFDLPSANDDIWLDYVRFLSKPWFGRIWIIQEYVSATNFTFLCGATTIAESYIIDPIRYLFVNSSFVSSNLQVWRYAWTNVLALATLKLLAAQPSSTEGGSPRRLSLIVCLRLSHNFDSTDPRDRIFAPALLCGAAHSDLIDYSQDLRKVLLNTAQLLLPTSGITLLLHSQPYGQPEDWLQKQEGRLPSWVPIRYGRPSLYDDRRPVTIFSQFHSRDGEWRFEVDKNKGLIISSCLLDQVKHAMEPIGSDSPPTSISRLDSHGEQYDDVRQIASKMQVDLLRVVRAKELVDRLQSYPSGLPVSEVFVQSIPVLDSRTSIAEMKEKVETLASYLKFLESLPDTDEWLPGCDCLADLLSVRRRTMAFLTRSTAVIVGAVTGLLVFSRGGPPQSPQRRMALRLAVLGLFSAVSLAVGHFARALKAVNHNIRVVKLAPIAREMISFYDKSRVLGRKLCLTERGYITWAPRTVAVGDEIRLLMNANLSFFVRRQTGLEEPSPPPSYKLIGDCNLYGLGAADIDIHMSRNPAQTIRIV